MSHEYKATIDWKLSGANFLKGQFSREHTWTFDGGLTVAASASPAVVPAPWSKPANVDPEEAFVASIASCHMLTFVWFASRGGFTLTSYTDEAVGVMTKNERGAMWVSTVTLNPQLVWSGERVPTMEEIAALHHKAHEECFIANSVKTDVRVAGVPH